MAKKTIAQLSASFVDGATVSGSNFEDIFDSNFNLSETGTSTAEGSLFLKGDLTANKYIVSSSVINREILDVSGSTHFGDSSDDIHTRTGSMNIKGPMNISGSITPDGSGSYDLGSEANPWREIYVMSSSINFMSDGVKLATISVDEEGKLETIPSGSTTVEPIASFPYSGSAEITGSLITRGSDVQFLSKGVAFSNAIGDDASSTGTYGVAIGTNASSSGAYSVAIGTQAETENTAEISIGLQAGYNLGANTSTYNVYIGAEAGEESDKATNTVLIGRQAGKANTKIDSTVAVGAYALAATAAAWTGSNSTAIGFAAGYDTHGDYMSIFGEQAAAYMGYGQSLANRKNSEIVAIGDFALYLSGIGLKGAVAVGTAAGQGVNGSRRPSGSYSTNVGYYSGLGAQNASGVAVGEKAGYFSDSSGSALVGAYAGSGSLGDHNIMLGYGAGAVVTGDNNIFIGEDVAKNGGTLNKHLKIGSGSLVTISGSLDTGDVIFANTASAGYFSGDGGGLTNVSAFPFVGDAVITGSLTISGSNAFSLDSSNVVLGANAGGGSVDTGTDDFNVIIGADAAGAGLLNSGDNNVVIGHSAGESMSSGDNLVIIGFEAGKVNTASTNIFIGSRAGQKNTTGYYNTFIGRDAGMECVEWQNNTYIGYTAGKNLKDEMNTAVGSEAMLGASAPNTAERNTAIGYRALYAVASNGDGNIAVGWQAGDSISSGTDNIVIGYNADVSGTGANQIAIGDGVTTTGDGDIRIGNGSTIPFSGSSVTGDVLFPSTASAAYFSGDGSNLTNLQRPITTVSANPFTASAANAGEYFRAGGNITCSIFPNSSVSCPVGSEFELIQTSSAGNLLITGSGVTINSKDGYLKLAGQFSAATLKKVGTDEWDLVGDLAE